MARTLEIARGTAYGRSVRGGAKLEDWPLLEKEPLRHRLQDFTSGTSGSPRRPTPVAPAVCRSSCCAPCTAIVFEQASIDRVIALAGADVRTARTVVLRGDNPRDLRALAQSRR